MLLKGSTTTLLKGANSTDKMSVEIVTTVGVEILFNKGKISAEVGIFAHFELEIK
jgi:hypothetical protein